MEPHTWTKQVLREGNSVRPLKLQEVNLTFSMRYLPSEVQCSSSRLYRIVVGRGDTLPALDEAISSMSVGELSQVTIPRNLINDSRFEKDRDLLVETEIKSFGRILRAQDCLGLEYRQEQAKVYRADGNSLMKEKHYRQASEAYRKGYELVELDTGTEVEQPKLLLLSNLSQAHLSCKEYEKCVQVCSKALASQRENQKLLYRRATALKHLGRYAQALCDAKQGLHLSENSKDFSQLIEQIQAHQESCLKKEKAVYAKMFG